MELVAAVLKVFNILQAISEHPEISLNELSKRLSMPKSTLYRFLQTMVQLGYVAQDKNSTKYVLTHRLFQLSSNFFSYKDLIKIADKEMRLLESKVNETINLGVLKGAHVVYIHKITSVRHVSCTGTYVGSESPVHCTALGKVLLAWKPQDEILSIIKTMTFEGLTKNTITDSKQFIKELKHTQKKQYAIDNQEQEDGLICLAMPIFDMFGFVVAGLSISLPSSRFSEMLKKEYLESLSKITQKISHRLGYMG